MNTASEVLIRLLSYSAFDFAVTSSEESKIISILRSDMRLGDTLFELKRKGFLSKLFDRVDSGQNPSILVQSLAGRLAQSSYPLAASAVRNHTSHLTMFENSYALQQFMKSNGLSSPSTAVSEQTLTNLLAKLPKPASTSPFSGSGATGIDPKSHSINAVHQALLGLKQNAIVAQYSNPLPGDLGKYLASLTQEQRKSQALVLLKRPIISIYPHSYLGALPSRADVIKIAARKYNLEPALIGGFVLAEQRDQSKNEDAKDYVAAASLMKGNTSIGMGQVVVSTARKHKLFSAALPAGASNSLAHEEIARLLTSDEFNILAVAKYVRLVADSASRMSASSLPTTKATFPNIDMQAFQAHSSFWPEDNIRALSSEYTSRAWDDRLVPGWSYFVFEAYKDIKSSGAL